MEKSRGSRQLGPEIQIGTPRGVAGRP